MGRKSRERYSGEFLLDTSYVLPLVGIGVEGIDESIYDRILQQRLYYPLAMTAELAAVIAKEVKKAGLDEAPEEAVEGFNSIVFGKDINVVLPEGSDVSVACELIRQGWNDIFDALLYATGRRMGVRVLTLDKEFRKFLEKHGYDHEMLVSHREVEEFR